MPIRYCSGHKTKQEEDEEEEAEEMTSRSSHWGNVKSKKPVRKYGKCSLWV